MVFASTFPAGFEVAIKKYLNSKSAQILRIEDGFVIYDSAAAIGQVREYPVFTNSFQVLAHSNRSLGQTGVVRAIKQLPSSFKTFQFRYVKSGVPQPTQSFALLIAAIERNGKAKHTSFRPELEVWLIERSSLISVLGLRITSARSASSKGELSPEIAYLLCSTAGVQKNETVLDPFAGFGAIPRACLSYFSVKECIAIEKIGNTKLTKLNHKHLRKLHTDFLTTTELKSGSIDRIVTDPPWGLYKKLDGSSDFYRSMIIKFDSVLRKHGVAVILINADNAEELTALAAESRLKLTDKFPVLVHGKKATVLRLQKIRKVSL